MRSLRKTSHTFLLTAFASVALLFAGCKSSRSSADEDTAHDTVGAGWKVFPAPLTGAVPGKMYYLEDGVRYPAGSVDVTSEVNDIAPADTEKHETFSGTALAELLRVPVNVGIKSTSHFTLRMKLGNATIHTTDSTVAEDKASAKATKNTEREWLVVVESIAATSIEYTFSTDSFASLGGEATLRNIVKANPQLTWDVGTTYTIKEAFSKPHFVYYLPRSVTPLAAPQHAVKHDGSVGSVTGRLLANNDATTTRQNVATVIDVLANDRIGDADVSVSLATFPAEGQGSATVVGKTIRYTPGEFKGSVSLLYNIRDSFGYTAQATVAITVNEKNCWEDPRWKDAVKNIDWVMAEDGPALALYRGARNKHSIFESLLAAQHGDSPGRENARRTITEMGRECVEAYVKSQFIDIQ